MPKPGTPGNETMSARYALNVIVSYVQKLL